MIRILIVGMTDTPGGIERFVINQMEAADPESYRFDVLCRFPDCAYSDRIRQLGGQVYSITRRSRNPIRFYHEIRRFFREHGRDYDVIWDHECMVNDITPLRLAKKYGIPLRIYHSHNPQNMDLSLKGRLQEKLHLKNRRSLKKLIAQLWACSEASADWADPARELPRRIIPNAIDASRFAFDAAGRRAIRERYGIPDSAVVIGHTGRLQYQKNPHFLLDCFARAAEKRSDLHFLSVGSGPELEALRQRAASLPCADRIHYAGQQQAVAAYLSAMDFFAFPSHFEGLGIALLEAQAAGLPCAVSDTLDRASDITGTLQFLPIDGEDARGKWIDTMCHAEAGGNRCIDPLLFTEKGFELSAAAANVQGMLTGLAGSMPRKKYILTAAPNADPSLTLGKARSDVHTYALEAGWMPIAMRCPDSARGSRLLQLRMLFIAAADWLRVLHTVKPGSTLLIQYPYFPLKVLPLAERAAAHLQKKGVRLAALIHDLDSLRNISGAWAVRSDERFLPMFDRIIVHNGKMADHLAGQGIPREKLTELTLFGYCCDGFPPFRTYDRSVTVAGNLSRTKSGWLYELTSAPLPYTLHLYGKAEEAFPDPVICHGQAEPEQLPNSLEGSFGLVWDGGSCEGCTGVMGEYLKLNDPHKLSLYIASGMPVIIWDKAACASFVTDNGLGYAVSSLHEIPALLDGISEEEYSWMAARVALFSGQIRSGGYQKKALEQL